MPTRATKSIKTFLYKACPRCHGDLVLEEELGHALQGQVEYVCLQCGRSVPIDARKVTKIAVAA